MLHHQRNTSLKLVNEQDITVKQYMQCNFVKINNNNKNKNKATYAICNKNNI